jgi:hypothetical protein
MAYDLASQLNYYPGQKKSLIKQSFIYQSRGFIDSAILCIQEHKVLVLSMNDSLSLAASYYQHGNLMRVQRRNTLAAANQ